MWPGRLILFALLAVDWAADPCQGACPFSAAFSSTETYTLAGDHREKIRRELAPAAPAPTSSRPAFAPARDCWPPSASTAPYARGTDLLRLYMTLRC
jgi:hypothetical protein